MRRWLAFGLLFAVLGCARQSTRHAKQEQPQVEAQRFTVPAWTGPTPIGEPFDWGEPAKQPPAPEADEPPPRPQLDAPAVRIDDDAFEAAMPDVVSWQGQPAAKPGRRVRMIIAIRDNCPPCEPVKRDAAWFQKSGWKFGDDPDGHVWMVNVDRNPEAKDEYNLGTATPMMLLLVDGAEVWRAEQYTGRDDLIAKFTVAVQSLPPLMTGDEGTFSAGEVLSPEIVEYILQFFGDEPGTLNLVNKEYHFKQGTTSLDVPKKVAGQYTVANGMKRIEFNPDKKLRGTWRFISSQIDAVTLNGTTLTLEIPGLPDPSIDLAK